jgi:protoporphyrinogen oxidase
MNVLILGGGLAGLSVATLLTRFGIQTTTITPEFGGVLSNYGVNNPFGEGVFRFDARFNAYVKEGAFHQLIRGVEGVTEHKRKAFYLEMPDLESSNWIEYPVQLHSHALIKGYPVEAGKPVGDNLEEVGVSAFGQAFYEDWFEPFNERMFSTDVNRLDVDWLTTKVAFPTHTAEDWGLDYQFVYAPGNNIVQTMVQSLIEYDADLWTWINGSSEGLFRTKDGWFCLTRSGSSVMNVGPFDAVVSTISIQELIGSLERIQGVNMPLANTNNIIGCGVMLEKQYEGKPFTHLYPDVSLRAHRVSLQSRLAPGMSPENHDSLLMEFPTYDFLTQNLIESYSLDVKTVLKLLGYSGRFQTFWFSNRGYAIPTLGIRADIAEVKRQLARNNVYSTGRWGSHSLLNNEHILGEALRTVNLLMSDEEEHEYLWSTDFYRCYEDTKYDS